MARGYRSYSAKVKNPPWLVLLKKPGVAVSLILAIGLIIFGLLGVRSVRLQEEGRTARLCVETTGNPTCESPKDRAEIEYSQRVDMWARCVDVLEGDEAEIAHCMPILNGALD